MSLPGRQGLEGMEVGAGGNLLLSWEEWWGQKEVGFAVKVGLTWMRH